MQEPLTNNKPEILDTYLGRLGAVAGTIIIAMILTAPSSISPVFILFFPSGLIYALESILGAGMSSRELSTAYMYYMVAGGLGWLVYLGTSTMVVMTSKRKRFFTFYAILVVMLVVNIAGCQVMQHPG